VEEPSRRRLRALAPAVERLPLRLAIALQLLRARPIALGRTYVIHSAG
jgi:hypothetical protein